MANSSWGLLGNLVTKHIDKLGQTMSEVIAGWDPETATEVDRDRLANSLREAATELEIARQSYNKEHNDVVNLKKTIEDDTRSLVELEKHIAAGTISEASANTFLDNLEKSKTRLVIEEKEEKNALEFMETVKKVVETFSEALADFDRRAKEKIQEMEQAKQECDLEKMKAEQQKEINSLTGGVKVGSSALNALANKAAKMRAEAAGIKAVAEVTQAPLNKEKEIENIRKSFAQPATETAMERLKRLAAENQAK